MEGNPKITVIMPVFRCHPYLGMAIDSILEQTFKDLELLIISEPNTPAEELETIKQYRDSRLKHVRKTENPGIVSSLNLGLKLARSPFIARMDGDDISLPFRLEKQIEFMERHPEVGVLGGQAEIIDKKGQFQGLLSLPRSHALIAWTLAFKNPLAHPTVMFRREIIVPNPYNREFLSEDYGLWIRLIFKTKFANLPESLIRYRFHSRSDTQVLRKEIYESVGLIRHHYLQNFLNLEKSDFLVFRKGLEGSFTSVKDLWISLSVLRKFFRSFAKKIKIEGADRREVSRDYRRKLKTLIGWYFKKNIFSRHQTKK